MASPPRTAWTPILAGYIAHNHPGFDIWVILVESKVHGTATITWTIKHRHCGRGTMGLLLVDPGTPLRTVSTDMFAQLEVAIELLGLTGG